MELSPRLSSPLWGVSITHISLTGMQSGVAMVFYRRYVQDLRVFLLFY